MTAGNDEERAGGHSAGGGQLPQSREHRRDHDQYDIDFGYQGPHGAVGMDHVGVMHAMGALGSAEAVSRSRR